MNVANILKAKGADVYTVNEKSAIKNAADVLGEKNIGAVVIVGENNAVVGIVSERDIVRLIAKRGADALNDSIASAMTKNVVTCTTADTVDGLMTLMTERRIRHVPVVEDGALKGIVSIGDVVKRRIRETEQEAEALKAYIAT